MAFAEPAVPVVITSILFTSIAFVAVVLRISTRTLMFKNAGPDDYLMCAAMVSCTSGEKHKFVLILSSGLVHWIRDCCILS